MFARYIEELNNFWALQGVSGAEIDKKDPVRKSGWGPLDGFEAMSRESAMRALAGFDSSTWLATQNAMIITGPTGQNLRDLRILLADSTA